MKKVLSYLIILFTLVTHIAAQDLRIVYIGNSITKGALLKDPTTEAPPVQASRYIEQQTNKKVIFRKIPILEKMIITAGNEHAALRRFGSVL